MPISKEVGRQYVLSAKVPFAFGDFGASGVIEPALDLPGGATVIGGELVITTAFNSGTSDVITVGDIGGTEDRYATAVDGQAAARTALTLNGVGYSAPAVIGIDWTGVGAAPTAGAGYVDVQYVMDGRAHEVQPQ